MIPAVRLEKLRDGQVTTYPHPSIVSSGRCSCCAHITILPEQFAGGGEIVSRRELELDPFGYTPTRPPATFRPRPPTAYGRR